MDKLELLELKKGFHQIDLNKMSAEQLVSFITPFIEMAGFDWEIREATCDHEHKVTCNHKLLTIAVGLKKLRGKK